MIIVVLEYFRTPFTTRKVARLCESKHSPSELSSRRITPRSREGIYSRRHPAAAISEGLKTTPPNVNIDRSALTLAKMM